MNLINWADAVWIREAVPSRVKVERKTAICDDCGFIDWLDFFADKSSEEKLCPRCKSLNITIEWKGNENGTS